MITLLCFAFLTLASCSQDEELFAQAIDQDIAKSNNQTDPNSGGDTKIDETVSKELKAFPTAYGAGAYTTGGRGGRVIHVTNLNDSGTGSLREAVMAYGPRIVVFDVSGTIHLLTNLNIHDGDLTIAGQTAPKGGITLTGQRIIMSNNQWNPNVKNIIIRYISIRPTFIQNGPNSDCIQMNNVNNVILDHISTSWGGDEAIEFRDISYNITVQRSILAESNTASIMGGGSNGQNLSHDLSFQQNLIYDCSHRFPNPNAAGRVDVLNNMIYNFRYRLTNAGGAIKLNHINNYFHKGKRKNTNTLILNKYTGKDSPGSAKIYSAGNLIKPDFLLDQKADNWTSWSTHSTWSYAGKSYTLTNPQHLPISFKSESSFSLLGSALPLLDTESVMDVVVNDSGNNKYLTENGTVVDNTSDLDKYYISNIKNNTPSDFEWNEDWSVYSHYKNFIQTISKTPIKTRPSNFDSDGDGMPDVWEKANGFDINTDDSKLDKDGDGYTNIEEYLNLVDY
ncbi:MAG: hypothetical protein ABJD66_05360 [Cellulophaga sp.]|uniref:pectate lyase family protein n=1 Tax=Cellulophaga sp. TaxID=1972202 RepID=UPI0032658621